MAPSTTLQSRIQAFEALSGSSSSKDIASSFHDVNPLDSPSSPSISSYVPILPSAPVGQKADSPTASPHTLASKSSLTDLKDWVIDDGPLPPLRSRQTRLEDLIASRHYEFTNGERSDSPSSSFKTKSPPPRPPTGSKRVLPPHTSHSSSPPPRPSFGAPLINLDSPQADARGKPGNAPPLPPRKTSTTSLRSVSTPSLSPIVPSTSGKGKNVQSALLKPSDADHTYPPNVSKLSLNTGRGHVPASSISSFHSVSLSSDGGGEHDRSASIFMQSPIDDKDKEWTDGDSLDESFENVSTSSFVPSLSITQYMQGTAVQPSKPEPPKLPQRPASTKPHTTSPSTLHATSSQSSPVSLISSPILTPTPSTWSPTTASRRPAPPPLPPPPTHASRSRPASARTSLNSTTSASMSDRASVMSSGTGTSVSSIGSAAFTPKGPNTAFSGLALGLGKGRPTPIPPVARVRYDTLFDKTLNAQKAKRREMLTPMSSASSVKSKGRRQNGWRGLSVDLITGGEVDMDDVDSTSVKASGDKGEERLEAEVVRVIWMRSRLGKERLKDIWSECDAKEQGSLDKDAFARGMWKIDEELKRAKLGLGKSAVGSAMGRKQVRKVASKPILR